GSLDPEVAKKLGSEGYSSDCGRPSPPIHAFMRARRIVMRALALICIVLFGIACGSKKPAATNSATSTSTMKPDENTKVDKDSHKAGDKDDDDKADDAAAKGAKK